MDNENRSPITNYEFRFQCPLKWQDLDHTDDEKVRFCRTCQKNVYFVEDQSQLNEFSSKNVSSSCVAFIPSPDQEVSHPQPPILGNLHSYTCHDCGETIGRNEEVTKIIDISTSAHKISYQVYLCRKCNEPEEIKVSKTPWWQFWK